MKTIEIDIDKVLSREELMETFQLNNLSKGDEIKLLSSNGKFAPNIMIIFAIALIITVFFKLTKKTEDKTEALIKGIFDKYDSEEELEKEIEAELGINFEFEVKKVKPDAIDELFGKWKNVAIDLNQIREKSWARSK